MKKLSYLSGIVLVLFLMGCSKQETQISNLLPIDDTTLKNSEKKKFKPFNATFEVSVDLDSELFYPSPLPEPPYPPTDPPPIPFLKYQEVYGDGNATHLGKTDVKLEQWWRPDLDPPPPPPGGEFYEWSGTGCGEIYFTAANGDLLLADYDGAIALHYTPDNVKTTLTGYFKDGGTGRFTKAEGWFLWEVDYDLVTNIGTVTATGEIKYSK